MGHGDYFDMDLSERDMIEEGLDPQSRKSRAWALSVLNEKNMSALYDHKQNLDKMKYKQFLNQDLKDVLRERGFERINMYDWRFTFPNGELDESRYIVVTFEDEDMIKVNFNDEKVVLQTPQSLLNCLLYKFYGYGNAAF